MRVTYCAGAPHLLPPSGEEHSHTAAANEGPQNLAFEWLKQRCAPPTLVSARDLHGIKHGGPSGRLLSLLMWARDPDGE